ncbi:hypothetical protein ACLM5H_16185 [Fredinandcohnia humi]
MKKIISNSFSLYTQEFLSVMLLSILTYVPLLVIHALLVNFIYQQTRFSEYPGLIGDMANGIFMLVFLTIAQIPFIKFTLLDIEGEDSILKRSLSFSMEKAVPVYLFACLYAVLIFLGGILFVVPGIVVLLLFYFVPFFISDSVRSFKAAISRSVKFVKKHFFKACLIIILLTVIQLTFESLLAFLLSFYTDVYVTFLLTKILLLMFLLPLQVIIMTNIYNAWKAV